MDLLVIRHAIAEDPAEFGRSGKSDDERPLTIEGQKKMRQGARGLREVVTSIGVLASSPLRRARETAEILADAYDGIAVVTVPALAPDQPPQAVADWLKTQRAKDPVAVVGHEPALSTLVSWLLTGATRSVIEVKKGAACLLDIPAAPGPATATLRWALAPAQLRKLGA